ncbi:MAG: SGNH/GDSL hydrolase family protein [Verrucomicrobiota bacterium]|nr:SGNH/GDSL hydrolase family protein [Verrucomicrobiota bacterium]
MKQILTLFIVCNAYTTFAQDKVNWHDVTKWGVEGRGWGDQERKKWFDRFPAKADGKVTPSVWGLSRHSAGMMVRFKTDADAIHAKWKVTSPRLGMPHMPPSGVSGLDLYARDSKGKWRWAAATRPSKQEMQATLLRGIKPGIREYAVYLPLYNGTESLAIGVVAGAKFERLAPRKAKPLIFYGTSITHGACASRPGMTHPAILGRRLDMPVINIGFSGNGKMHAAVGDLMAEVDAAVYIIDCLPNMNAAAVNTHCVPLVKQLRKAHQHTPIVLVEDRRNANSWLMPARSEYHDANHAALRKAYEQLKAAGVKHLHYLGGDALLGADGEGTTDGSHPNDLGFVRQADAFEPALRKALGVKPE